MVSLLFPSDGISAGGAGLSGGDNPYREPALYS